MLVQASKRGNPQVHSKTGCTALCGLAGWWLQSVGLGLWEDRNATRVVGLRAAWKNTTVVDAVTAREPFARVVSHLVFQGQPADCTVDLGSAEHVWTWANGQLIRQKGWGWASGAVRAGMLGLRPEELDALLQLRLG